jgi:preprotein translocase subunit SecG
MHDGCLNEMLHVKISGQREDVPEYVQILGSGNASLVTMKVNCEICLDEIFLERSTRFNLSRLTEVNAEIYLILVVILCLSGYGLSMAFTLLMKAQQEDDLLQKIMHFGADVWIIGVILYVMVEPLYSEVKIV